ncbi:similar to An12g09890 [Aspergillus luchuensis]|uniref:Similar to An12g09890 n=1 Tax=Aspergillus kawachii TaxID=1069201 RepID=A0A146FCR8_ASPKA|nr:similar to An12g09890 [Aspergillus luchuensis]
MATISSGRCRNPRKDDGMVAPALKYYYFPDELGASSRPVVASAWGCVLPPSWRATSESLRCLRKVQDRPEDATVLRTILEPFAPQYVAE